MEVKSGDMNRGGSGTKRRWATVLGAVFLIGASIYLCFAAAVMLVLALTDITGFLTNAPAVALFLVLIGSALMLMLFGLRTLRRTRIRRNTPY